MQDKSPAVVCLSGGMDSTSLLLRLIAEQRSVFAISFDYGQKHKLELIRLAANLDYLKSHGFAIAWNRVDLSTIAPLLNSALTSDGWDVPTGHYASENMKQTVVPNRNAIFASIAFAYALSITQRLGSEVDLSLGVHAGDHAIYPDCRPEFYEAIFAAFKIGNWDADSIKLCLPYLNWNKAEILRDAMANSGKLGLDFNTLMRNTLTSYAPTADGRSSGLTGSDVERILAFHAIGEVDPIDYAEAWETLVERALRWEQQQRGDR